MGATERELTAAADVESIGTVTAFIDEILEAAGCPVKAQLQIDIAVDELLANIAQYAYAPDKKGDVSVRVVVVDEPPSVSVTFTDGGVRYDPLAKPDPDVTLSAEERGIGGLGIYMVKKSMDDIFYEYRDGKNTLTIVKKW